jgi:uncharacterized protein
MERLQTILRSHAPLLVGLSGGVDSSVLLAVAVEILGKEAVAGAIVVSEGVTGAETVRASRVAQHVGASLFLLSEPLLGDRDYVANDGRRCYYCRRHMYRALRDLADQLGMPFVADGAQVDDPADERPGFVARDEAGVISPLQMAGWNKARVRMAAADRGLPTAREPANACLASRIPPGTPVTRERLRQVESAEAALRTSGLRQVRVRHHGELARVELGGSDLFRLPSGKLPIAAEEAIRTAGFQTVTVAPYRGEEEAGP